MIAIEMCKVDCITKIQEHNNNPHFIWLFLNCSCFFLSGYSRRHRPKVIFSALSIVKSMSTVSFASNYQYKFQWQQKLSPYDVLFQYKKILRLMSPPLKNEVNLKIRIIVHHQNRIITVPIVCYFCLFIFNNISLKLIGNWKVTNIHCVLAILAETCPHLTGITLTGWKGFSSDNLIFLVEQFKSLRRIDLSSINVSTKKLCFRVLNLQIFH